MMLFQLEKTPQISTVDQLYVAINGNPAIGKYYQGLPGSDYAKWRAVFDNDPATGNANAQAVLKAMEGLTGDALAKAFTDKVAELMNAAAKTGTLTQDLFYADVATKGYAGVNVGDHPEIFTESLYNEIFEISKTKAATLLQNQKYLDAKSKFDSKEKLEGEQLAYYVRGKDVEDLLNASDLESKKRFVGACSNFEAFIKEKEQSSSE